MGPPDGSNCQKWFHFWFFGIRRGKGVIVVQHAALHLPFHHGNSQRPSFFRLQVFAVTRESMGRIDIVQYTHIGSHD
jgi:hypothetical protein